MAGGGVGVPDGSSFKTIVVEHRSFVTFQPNDSGNIGFAIVANPLGAVAYNTGSCTLDLPVLGQRSATAGTANSLPQYPSDIKYSTITQTLAPSATARGNWQPDYAVIPFNEWKIDDTGFARGVNTTNILAGPINQSGLRIAKWRTITSVARISYVGNSLHNSGVMAVARSPGGVGSKFDIKVLILDGASQTTGTLEDCVLAQAAGSIPTSFDNVAAMPGAKVIPVRCGADVICPPSDFVWHEWEDAFFLGRNTVVPEADSTDVAAGEGEITWSEADQSKNLWNPAFGSANWYNYVPGASGETVLAAGPLPGWSNNDVSYVQIQGMEAAQAMMVEVRTCCEYSLAFNSPAARFAKDSPRPRPAATKAVLDIARKIPATKPPDDGVSWLSSAINSGRDVLAGPVGQALRGLAKLAISSFAPTNALALLG